MARPKHTPPLASLEEAITVLFCLIDDAYRALNPGWRSYESIKQLSDSEVLALALLQQLRGVESERSFLRDTERFFSHLFPGVLGLHPSSLHRRVKKLRCFLEPLRREVLGELVGDPETLIVDSTLLEVLHPRQVAQSAGFPGAEWVRWGSFAVYGVKLHLVCSTNRVPVSYEITPANTADVLVVRELLAKAGLEEGTVARRLLGDLWPTAAGRWRRSWLRPVCCWRPSGRTGGRRSASRWRCASRPLSASSGWMARWQRRWWAWSRGSPRRWRPTPTGSTSTGSSGGRRGASGSCGPEILATLI